MTTIQNPQLGPQAHAAASLGRPVAIALSALVSEALQDTEGATVQITTITAGGATNDGVYTLTFTSGSIVQAVSYTADASATVTEIAAGLAAAILAEGILGAIISTATNVAGVLTITALRGKTFTVALTANPNTDLSQAATQAYAAAPQYLFGQAVERVAMASGNPSSLGGLGCRRPVAIEGAYLTLTIVHDAGDTYTVAYTYESAAGAITTSSFDFAAGADLAAAVANCITAAEADFPNATVTNPSAGVVRIALEAGANIWGVVGSSDDAGTCTASAVTAPASIPDFRLVVDDGHVPQQESYTGALSSASGPLIGSAIPCAKIDASVTIAVTNNDTPVFGDPVYVTPTTGALYKTASASRIPWPGVQFAGVDPRDSTLALITGR